MKHVSAILLAAGKGKRLKAANSDKPLIAISSLPLLVYSLKALSRHPLIRDIIVAVNSANSARIKSAIKKYRIRKVRRVVLGGKERRDSVANALKALRVETEFVLVHDGARPFIDKKMITLVVRAAQKFGAAIVGVPVKATIKKVRRTAYGVRRKTFVRNTIDRNNLWQIQTPQVFRKDLILKAYKKYRGARVTDDASLVEKLGVAVGVVRGSYSNIKITTPEDLLFAREIARGGKF
ncbi:2-C-methyl-D-erythritol 4-phosphate cytidylyltransferase [Candidatus Omnitrophota bacterium]